MGCQSCMSAHTLTHRPPPPPPAEPPKHAAKKQRWLQKLSQLEASLEVLGGGRSHHTNARAVGDCM